MFHPLRYSKPFMLFCLISALALFALLTSPSATAKASQADAPIKDVKSLLNDYSLYLSTDATSHKAAYSPNMASLVQERRDFYAELFKMGLHSTLISMKSQFVVDDITTSITGDITHITVFEVVTMYGKTDVKTPEDYPLIPAARWAISKTKDKAEQEALQRYIESTTQSVNESISNGVEEVFRINHSIDIANLDGGLQIISDAFTDRAIDIGDGVDNVTWVDGKPVRTRPDLTSMPDYVFHHTPIEVLGQQLLDDYTKAYGGTSHNLTPAPSLSAYSFYYNGQTAKDYALAHTTDSLAATCPADHSVIMDTSHYNPSYYSVWANATTTCNDCVDYVSQALRAGGFPVDDVWNYWNQWGIGGNGTYAWRVIDDTARGPKQGFQYYLQNTRQAVTVYPTYTSLLVGDLLVTDDPKHVVMVTRISPWGFSGHTNDRKNHIYMGTLTKFWHIPNLITQYYIFADVPPSHWAWKYAERLRNNGITAGCSTNPLRYCPDSTLTRAQMAVFILKGKHGAAYTPPAATGTVFLDVSANSFAAAWIEQLVAENITAGCGNGNYCPDSIIIQSQMAVFLLRAKQGSGYTAPAATGEIFDDVPSNYWAASWIEELYNEGIGFECYEAPPALDSKPNYCPDTSVTRAQMAALLVPTFNLP